MLENRVLRKTFSPKRGEITGGCRAQHNEELYALCFSQNIIRVIKSRRMRWAGQVPRMGERRGAYRALVRKHEGREYLEDLRIDGRIILNGSSRNGIGAWTGLLWLGIGAGGGGL
jgi:hypothetical protein